MEVIKGTTYGSALKVDWKYSRLNPTDYGRLRILDILQSYANGDGRYEKVTLDVSTVRGAGGKMGIRIWDVAGSKWYLQDFRVHGYLKIKGRYIDVLVDVSAPWYMNGVVGQFSKKGRLHVFNTFNNHTDKDNDIDAAKAA